MLWLNAFIEICICFHELYLLSISFYQRMMYEKISGNRRLKKQEGTAKNWASFLLFLILDSWNSAELSLQTHTINNEIPPQRKCCVLYKLFMRRVWSNFEFLFRLVIIHSMLQIHQIHPYIQCMPNSLFPKLRHCLF